jgi:hypothetical protein
MNRTMIVVAALTFTFPVAGMAQTNLQTATLSAPMTPHDVHNLMKSASSSAQYLQLADFFHKQEADYRAKAADEKIERDRRAQVNAALYQKYPRPVDSAQYLYESYLTDADTAALRARHYDQLAATQTQHDQQLATTSQSKLQ